MAWRGPQLQVRLQALKIQRPLLQSDTKQRLGRILCCSI